MCQRPPDGWGADDLTSFFETVRNNQFATFANSTALMRLLVQTDRCFTKVHRDWKNPGGIVAPMLSIRSHSAFRAACGLATSGQVTDAFPQIRATLEYASYCAHMRKRPKLEEVWLQRHDSDDTLKAAKAAFKISAVRESIADAQNARVFNTLYQRSIDFGAHPNERGLSASTTISRDTEGVKFQQVYLHVDGVQLDHALKTTAQAGVCSLRVIQEAYPDRFDAVGSAELLTELMKQL